MWSAIPVALLCMIVNWSERKQGDLRLFVRSSPQALSGLKSALSGLKSALSDLKSALSGFESVRAELERTSFRPKRAYFRPQRADSRPERADFRPGRLGGQIISLRGQISGLRGPGGGGRMDGRTDKQKSPAFYRTWSPLGLLPCLPFLFTTMQDRATGIADHELPMGDLFFTSQ